MADDDPNGVHVKPNDSSIHTEDQELGAGARRASVDELQRAVTSGRRGLDHAEVLRSLALVECRSASSDVRGLTGALRALLAEECERSLGAQDGAVAAICLGLDAATLPRSATERYEDVLQLGLPRMSHIDTVRRTMRSNLIPRLVDALLERNESFDRAAARREVLDGSPDQPSTMRSITWQEFGTLAARVLELTRGDGPTSVLGVARGGLPLAACLSSHLQCRSIGTAVLRRVSAPGADPAGVMVEVAVLPKDPPSRIVIAMDVVGRADAVRALVTCLRLRYPSPRLDIVVATLFLDPSNLAQPELGQDVGWAPGELVDTAKTRLRFPWEQAER